MKKVYSLLLFAISLGSTIKTQATIVNVAVSDFQFTPSNFTINAGDTIMWFWVSGFHTTTSDNIPGSANAWDELIDPNSQMFMYVPTVSGNYTYECDFHSMMQASFTVTGNVGISSNSKDNVLWLLSPTTSSTSLNITYSIPSSGNVELKIFDILGTEVKTAFAGHQRNGVHSININVASLSKGIYILRLSSGKATISRRIMIQ